MQFYYYEICNSYIIKIDKPQIILSAKILCFYIRALTYCIKFPLDYLSQYSEAFCTQELINWNTKRCRKLTLHILSTDSLK